MLAHFVARLATTPYPIIYYQKKSNSKCTETECSSWRRTNISADDATIPTEFIWFGNSIFWIEVPADLTFYSQFVSEGFKFHDNVISPASFPQILFRLNRVKFCVWISCSFFRDKTVLTKSIQRKFAAITQFNITTICVVSKLPENSYLHRI